MKALDIFEYIAGCASFKVTKSADLREQHDKTFREIFDEGCSLKMREYLSCGAALPDKTTVFLF